MATDSTPSYPYSNTYITFTGDEFENDTRYAFCITKCTIRTG